MPASFPWSSCDLTVVLFPLQMVVLRAIVQPQIAIRAVDGGLSLTYGDLYASAQQGATALRAAGIKSGSLVGLMVSCSVEGCIGVLSIILAGGAYVPLDPNYPPNRLTQIIEGAQLTCVLTATSTKAPSATAQKQAAKWLKSAWPDVSALEITVHRESGETTPLNTDELKSLHQTSTDKTLVAVLFTSGSTGKPKGVPGYEAGVLAGARFFTTTFPYGENEVVVNHITYGWVDHKMELWHALLRGKEILVVPDTAALIEMVDKPPERVDKLWAVPTLLDALFQVMEAKVLKRDKPPAFLSLVVATGEALTPPMVERYRKLVPEGTIVSSYGLTETQGETSVATYSPSRAVNDMVSIGSPHSVYSYGIRSLETSEWLTAAGAQGELYIAGPLILDGYYKRADGVCLADDAANARFSLAAPEVWPLSRGSPARMYQTGDLVMRRTDGEVQHLGRCDDQVKVNGVRIELGHVSSAALKCTGVADARAAAAKDANDNTRIVIFVTGSDAGSSSSQLMSELADHLPSVYMPTTCVCLKQGMPQLPNGKVDRKGLDALAKNALVEHALETENDGDGPSDSISRLISGAGSKGLPGWHFICMHFVFFAMFSMFLSHMGFFGWYFWKKDHTSPGSHRWVHWIGVGMDISHAMLLAFFASGYVDLVAMPPKTFKEACKRLGIVVAFYIIYQPIASILKIGAYANLWPVALLVFFRLICWPLRALMLSKFGLSALAVTITLASISTLAAAVCRPWDGATMCAGPMAERLFIHFGAVLESAPMFQSMLQDVRQLLAYNSGIALFPAYAAFPLIVDYFLGDVWKNEAPKQPPTFANPSFMTMARLRLSEPRIYRRILATLYIILYQIIIIHMFAINNGIGNLATRNASFRNGPLGMLYSFLLSTLQGVLCAALFVLLPSRATPFSAIGSCALGSYVLYLGFIEPVTLITMGNSVRFVNAPYHPHTEVFQLGLLAVTALVGASFSFGLSSPFNLPSWAAKASSLGGVLPPAATLRVPVVNFPAGKFAFLLAWVVMLAIPNCLIVPPEMRYIIGHKVQKHYNDARNPNINGSPLQKAKKTSRKPSTKLLESSDHPNSVSSDAISIPSVAATSIFEQPEQLPYMGLRHLRHGGL